MTDERLRASERRWREGGDPDEELRWLRERLRAGTIDPRRLEVASLIGHPASRALVGPPPGVDPTRVRSASTRGVEVVPVEEPTHTARLRLVGWTGDHRRLATVLDATLATGVRSVLLEVVDAASLSSSFLATLVARAQALQAEGSELLLVDLPGPYTSVIDMLGLSAFVGVYPDPTSGLGAIRAARWSTALATIDAEGPLRLALAALHATLPGWDERFPHDWRPKRLAAALTAWLAAPDADRSRATIAASLDLEELALADLRDQTLAWGLEIGRLPPLVTPREAAQGLPLARPTLPEPLLPAVRADVLDWLLA